MSYKHTFKRKNAPLTAEKAAPSASNYPTENRVKTMNKLEISNRCSFKHSYVLALFGAWVCGLQHSAGLIFCKKSFKKEHYMFDDTFHFLKGYDHLQKPDLSFGLKNGNSIPGPFPGLHTHKKIGNIVSFWVLPCGCFFFSVSPPFEDFIIA